MQKSPKKSKNDTLVALAKVTGMGLQMGLIIYGGNMLGAYLDEKFEQSFIEASATLLSIAVAIYSMITQAKKI